MSLVLFLSLCLGYFIKIAPPRPTTSWMNDVCSAYYLHYARNLLRYPLSLTKGSNLNAVGALTPRPLLSNDPKFDFYPDHPPLLVWFTSLFMKVVPGNPVFAGRLLSILSSLVSLGIVIYFALLFGGIYAAISSAAIMISTRIFWEHGVVLNYEPLTCALILMSLWAFYRYFVTKNQRYFYGALVFQILSQLTDWPAYFLTPIIGLFLLQKKEYQKSGICLSLALILGTCWDLYQKSFLSSTQKQEASRNFMDLLNMVKGSSVEWGALGDVGQLLIYSFSKTHTAIFLVGLLFLFFSQQLMTRWKYIVLSVLCVGVCNIMIFLPWASLHSFWGYYLLPVVAWAGAWLVEVPFKFRSASRFNFKMLMTSAFLALSLYKLRGLYLYFERNQGLETSVESVQYFSNPGVKIYFVNKRNYFGIGYIPRWILDRPADFLTLLQLTHQDSNSWIVIMDYDYLKFTEQLPELRQCDFKQIDGWHLIQLNSKSCLTLARLSFISEGRQDLTL